MCVCACRGLASHAPASKASGCGGYKLRPGVDRAVEVGQLPWSARQVETVTTGAGRGRENAGHPFQFRLSDLTMRAILCLEISR